MVRSKGGSVCDRTDTTGGYILVMIHAPRRKLTSLPTSALLVKTLNYRVKMRIEWTKDNPTSRSQWSKIHLFGDSDPKFGGNGRGVFSFIDKDTEASVSVHAFILTHVLGNEDWMAAFRLDEDEDLLKWLKAKESNQDGVHNEMNVKVHFSYFTMSGVSEGWGGDCSTLSKHKRNTIVYVFVHRSYLQIHSISNIPNAYIL
jgi:hypothetical protein